MSTSNDFGESGCRAVHPATPRGDFLRALQSLTHSLEADPDSYEAWIELSSLFLRIRDLGRAEQCLAVARRLRDRRASRLSGASSETATA